MESRRALVDHSGGKASLVSDQVLRFIRTAVAKRMDDHKKSSNEHHQHPKLHSYSMTETGIIMVIRMDKIGECIREKCALGTSGLPGLRYVLETRLNSILECVYAHGGDVTQWLDFDDFIVCSFSRSYEHRITSFSDDQNEDSEAGVVDSNHVKHLSDYKNALKCAKKLELMDTHLSDFHKAGKDIFIQVSITYGQQRMFCLGGYRTKAKLLASTAATFDVTRTDRNEVDKEEWDNRVFVTTGSINFDVFSYFGAPSVLKKSSVVVDKSCFGLFSPHLLDGDSRLDVSALPDGHYLVESIEFPIECDIHESGRQRPVEEKVECLESIDRIEVDPMEVGIINRLAPPMIKLNECQLHLMVSMFLRFRVPLLSDSSISPSADGTAQAVDVERLQVLVYAIQAILFENGSFIKQMTIVNNNTEAVLSAFWFVPSDFQSEAQETHIQKQLHLVKCLLALSVAVALRDKLETLNTTTSIGISTGNVCIGVRGCEVRSELAIMGFNVEAAAYLMKIAPDNCIYLSQSASIRLPFQLLDRLMILKPRVKLNKDFDNMVSFMYNSRVLLSIADTDFYEIHEEVKKAYQAAVKVMKNKDQTQGRSSQCNTLQFIVVEGCYGSGKKTNLDWIMQQALLDDVTHYSYKLEYSDGLIDYHTVSKIFRLLVRDDIMNNTSRQTIFIRRLLRDVYHNRLQYIRDVASSAMKIAFGVTCDMKIELQGSSVKSQVGLVKSQVGSQVGSFVKSQVGLTSPSINSVNSVSSNSLASLSGDEVLNVVNDVLGYLLKVKPVIICIHNVHFMDQSSAEAISRLMTLQCKSLFVFAASPSSEQFNYPLFQSTPHLIKQQPTLKYPDELQKFSSRCYLQWFSSLRDKLLKGNGAAKFIFIDRLDNEDMQDKIKGAIIVSRLNDRIANNDKEYESVLDIPKVLTMILHFTGVNMFWLQMCLELVKEVGLKQFFHLVDIERRTVYMKEEDMSIHSTSSNKFESSSIAFPLLDTSTVYPQSLVPDMLKFRKLVLCRFELLSPTEQVVLLSATVVGFTFTSPVIVSLCPIIMSALFNSNSSLKSTVSINSADVAKCVASFARSHWTIETSFVKHEFRFAHPIIYLNLRSLIPLDQLDKVHVEMIKSILLKQSKLNSDYYLQLGMHFSHVKESNALDNTVKAVITSMKPANIKSNLLLVLELLHYSQVYCSSSIDAMIIGKAILLISKVLGKYLHESLVSQSAESSNSDFHRSFCGFLTRIFIGGGKSTSGSLMKVNKIAPDKESSFHSNSSGHSDYTSVTAIIRSQQLSKYEPPLRFTVSATSHILDLLNFLKNCNDAICASFNLGKTGINSRAAGWQINTLETLDKLLQRHSNPGETSQLPSDE